MLLEQKYVVGLIAALANKAESSEVILSDFSNVIISDVRNTLEVYSRLEVDSFLNSQSANTRIFNTKTELTLSTGWNGLQKAITIDDGDGKWAIYTSFATGSGLDYPNADFRKTADEDSLSNALSSATILAALEANGTGSSSIVGMLQAERDKLALITVGTAIDLDSLKNLLDATIADATNVSNSITALNTAVSDNTNNIATNNTAIQSLLANSNNTIQWNNSLLFKGFDEDNDTPNIGNGLEILDIELRLLDTKIVAFRRYLGGDVSLDTSWCTEGILDFSCGVGLPSIGSNKRVLYWNGYRWYKSELNTNDYPIQGEECQGRGDGRYEFGEWCHFEFKRDMPEGQATDQNLDINLFNSYT